MRLPIRAAMLLAAAGGAQAADYYMTAKGAGAQNGVDWDASFSFASIDDVLNRTMEPGDTLHLEGASYGRAQILIESSGTLGAAKKIVGEDRGNGLPLIGPTDREWMNWKQYGLLLRAGSSHWVFKNLQFQMYAEPTVCTEGGHTGLVFEGLRILRAYVGFQLVDCHDTVLDRCYATRYSAEGFLFLKHCDRVTLRHCEADGSQKDPPSADVSQVGYQVGRSKDPEADGNAGIVFEDCLARNNLESDRGQKWVQGDGFVAERASRGLRFRRCRSFGATDGCFDLKAQIDEFADCVAMGPGRGFKMWAQVLTMTNCIAIIAPSDRGRTTGTTCGLEANNRRGDVAQGGHLTAQGCTFVIRNRGPVVWGESGRVTMNDCVVAYASPGPEGADGKAPGADVVTVTFQRTAIHGNASDSGPPDFIKPTADWDGTGTNYDSRTYGPGKGYHSSRVGKAR